MSIKYKGKTISGPPGAVYTPSVSESGVLSWTNNGDLKNPAPIDIRGPQGEQGPQGEKGDKGEPGAGVTMEQVNNAINIAITGAIEVAY